LLSYEKLVKIRPNEPALQFLLADVYQKQGRWLEEEDIYRGLQKTENAPAEVKKQAYKRMIGLVEKQQRYLEQDQLLAEYDLRFGQDWESDRGAFYLKMVERYPNNLDWLGKQANYYFGKGATSWASDIYQQILQKDSLRHGAGFMHTTLASTAQTDKDAIAHYEAAMHLMPGLSSPKFKLAEIYHRQMEYEKEIALLEDLLRSNQINLDHRLKLADLCMLSGRYKQADSLLITADEIKLEEVEGLDELRGKLDLLRGENLSAIEFYKKVLATKRVETEYTIARLYARAGDKDQAWKWLQKAIADGFQYKKVIQNDEAWKDYPQRLDAGNPSSPSGGQ
jgi:hypothetical protein